MSVNVLDLGLHNEHVLQLKALNIVVWTMHMLNAFHSQKQRYRQVRSKAGDKGTSSETNQRKMFATWRHGKSP